MKYKTMTVSRLSNILHCLVTLTLVHATIESDVKYIITEEQPIGTHIGTIKNDFDIRSAMSQEEYNNLVFSLFSTGNPYAAFFKINNKTSDLVVGSRIDRDTLPICTFTAKCILSLDFGIQAGGAFFRKLKVEIEVEDINDNSPSFSVTKVDLRIAESTIGRSSASISGALDSDTVKFSVTNYRILELDTPFGIQFEKFVDGSSVVNIVVLKELDRERQDLYTITLVAEDGGSPTRTGTLQVNVIITDVNDNAPKFIHSLYNITVKEDIELNSTILTVYASDADSGENGEIFYRLSTHQAENIHMLFSIDPVSGNLSVVDQLVYVPNEIMRVFVEASDKGVPPKISQTIVYVHIEDSNNNPPQININILAGWDVARVSEFANVGTVVAHIGVVDDDTGRNGIVTCTGVSDRFGLERLDVKEYKVVVTKPLDRELSSFHVVNVVCQDNGVPSLNSSRRFTVEILDENDVAPRFTQGTYFAKIEENNKIGDLVTKVSAEDLDKGINAEVTYTIIDNGGHDFRINSETGEISAYVTLDRENVSRVILKVKAVDGGTNPKLTGEATVVININDQNDNAPLFGKASYNFVIEENTSIGSKVGNIIAEDSDNGENGTVLYTLQSSTSYFPFTLFPNGTIVTAIAIDREIQSRYDFRVVASDQGRNPLRSVVAVAVSITDQNDNNPVFVFPRQDNNTVTVSYFVLPNTVVATVTANDADDGQNARLVYTIIDNNVTDIFSMESETGNIILIRKLTSSDPVMFTIKVKVEDKGLSRLSSTTYLTISLSQDNKVDEGGDNNHNFLIAISLSCITFVLSVAILLVICLIRRHDRLKSKSTEGYWIENKSGNTTPRLFIQGDELKKVNVPFEHDSSNNMGKSKEDVQAPFFSDEIYQISNGVKGDTILTRRDSGLSSCSEQRTNSDGMTFSTHQQPCDQFRTIPLDGSLVRSSEELWIKPYQAPPLTKDILILHDDNGCESNASDSGRGGSEPDVQCTAFPPPQNETDTPKSVKFASKPLFRRIDNEPTWGDPNNVSSIHPKISTFFSSNVAWNQSIVSSSLSRMKNDILVNKYKNHNDLSPNFERNQTNFSPNHDYRHPITNSHHKSELHQNSSQTNVRCIPPQRQNRDSQDITTFPTEDSSVGASYDEDDDTTTSGSYTIDSEEWYYEPHHKSGTDNLTQYEAYC
ncbi:hypothetical protein ACJMK2_032946 [Sinanodonta woodiana]|uniref:Cadherin domain-containing protein n=1 Tax=Sinanodonta woodiana TaxID=1069815 RepID=A0ABD3X3B0_SINWO